ncbi:hypothetical protein ACSBR2_010187 [Camellia fascicularis]
MWQSMEGAGLYFPYIESSPSMPCVHHPFKSTPSSLSFKNRTTPEIYFPIPFSLLFLSPLSVALTRQWLSVIDPLFCLVFLHLLMEGLFAVLLLLSILSALTLRRGLDVLMETKGGKKKSSSSKSLFYEAPLGYSIEDLRPHGGIKKFRSAAYSNCARKPS